MLKSCSYCRRIHDSKIKCNEYILSKSERNKRVVRTNEQVRYTYKMNKKSLEIKEQANFLCEVCKDYRDLETHHIEKLLDRPDLALDDNNLICLCRKCHILAENGSISKEKLRKIISNRNK